MKPLRSDSGRRTGWLVGIVLVALVAVMLPGVGQAAEPNIAIDGNLESAYGQGTTFAYTRDSGDQYNGFMSVVQGDEWIYMGFRQAAVAKSNVYCESDKDDEECYQKFGSLVGSDHITFEWEQYDIVIPVDIISEVDDKDGTSTPSGYVGGIGTGDGGDLEGLSANDVQGKSAMDYNFNVFGWRNEDNSPNKAGSPDCNSSGQCYVYPSIAEIRIRKSALPAGFDPLKASVITHNSPAAPTEDQPRKFVSINCPSGGASGKVGEDVSLTINAVRDGQPSPNENILVLLTGPGSVKSVGGTNGNRGKTGSNGAATVVLTSNTAGTTQVRGVLDENNDGVWQQGAEPTTEPTCPVNWGNQPPPPPPPPPPPAGPQITIVKDGPQRSRIGETINYTMDVFIEVDRRLHNVTVSDPRCDSAPTLVEKTKGDTDEFLEFGEVWKYTCPHKVRASDPNPLPNTATATGIDDANTQVSDEDSHLVELVANADIRIVKDGPQDAEVGQEIRYTMEVSIPVDHPLTNVQVSDPRCDGQPSLDNKTGGDDDNVLEFGETWIYHCTRVATESDVPSVLNTATATGEDRNGETVRDRDDHKVNVEAVLGEQITRPENPPSGVLPFTGSSLMPLILLAAGMVLTGAGARHLSRRRPQDES